MISSYLLYGKQRACEQPADLDPIVNTGDEEGIDRELLSWLNESQEFGFIPVSRSSGRTII